MTAQFPVFLKGCFVGGKILLCPVNAKGLDEFVIDESVLTGQLGGGIFGNAAANRFFFCQHIGYSGLLQKVGAQDACHAAANDQNTCGFVALEPPKVWMRPGLFP